MKLEMSTAFVTGASGGLGRQFVQQLLDQGAAKVYAASRRPTDFGDSRVVQVSLDVTDPIQIAEAVALADDIDILINNAGVVGPPSLLHADSNELRDVIETNALGPLELVRRFLPALERSGGAVVNVASVLSWLAQPGVYSPSKALLWGLTNSLRLELRDLGIHVLGAHLAYADTPMTADLSGVHKSDPAVIVGRILDALANDDEECVADDVSRSVKENLSLMTTGTRPPSGTASAPASQASASGLFDVLPIEFDPIEPGQPVRGVLTVDQRHHTPWGIVHGGVWATVIESAASIGASAAVQERGMFAAGLNNLTDFVRSITAGTVEIVATPRHIGSTTQYWAAEITAEDGRLVASGRVRLANLPLRNEH